MNKNDCLSVMTIFENVDKNIKLDKIKSQNIEHTLNVTTVDSISSKKAVDDPFDLHLIPGMALLYLLNIMLV